MALYWWSAGPLGVWRAPALLGLVLIGLGILLFIFPQVFAFAAGTLLLIGGVWLLGLAWRLRTRVSYRPVEEQWRIRQNDDEGTPHE